MKVVTLGIKIRTCFEINISSQDVVSPLFYTNINYSFVTSVSLFIGCLRFCTVLHFNEPLGEYLHIYETLV